MAGEGGSSCCDARSKLSTNVGYRTDGHVIFWNLRSFNVSAMAVRENPSSTAVKRASCEACGEVMSLARIEPYTIGGHGMRIGCLNVTAEGL